jgi:hypothetical protein
MNFCKMGHPTTTHVQLFVLRCTSNWHHPGLSIVNQSPNRYVDDGGDGGGGELSEQRSCCSIMFLKAPCTLYEPNKLCLQCQVESVAVIQG